MNKLELIRVNQKLMEMLDRNNIKVSDVRLIPLMKDLEDMKDVGYKKTYILSSLSKKYKISERTIYLAIKRVTKQAKIDM